ncbi:MAG: hypothetical protein ABFD69_15090 [Candidatus Sumerlaeia bacterium]
MSNGPKYGSGKRTGAFAESKFTNWMPYHPIHAEVKSTPRGLKPDAEFKLPDGSAIGPPATKTNRIAKTRISPTGWPSN